MTMICFDCPTCGNEFEVDDKSAGLRGKCPKCKAIVRVPETSQNALEIIGDTMFSSSKLNALYSSFVDEYDHKILKHNVIDGDSVELGVVEIMTGGMRSQVVLIYRLGIEESDYVGFVSSIGIITLKDTAVEALRTVDISSRYTLSMDEDNTLKASTIRKLDNFDVEEFADIALRIAHYADWMEKAIFDTDTN